MVAQVSTIGLAAWGVVQGRGFQLKIQGVERPNGFMVSEVVLYQVPDPPGKP